jgi:hypothetical protein
VRFLAIGHHTDKHTVEAAEALMAAEMRTARDLYREGLIREAYMDESYSQAVLLLDATDLHTATEQLGRYPMVRAGLIHFQIISLVGLPAITDTDQSTARPAWWPDAPAIDTRDADDYRLESRAGSRLDLAGNEPGLPRDPVHHLDRQEGRGR